MWYRTHCSDTIFFVNGSKYNLSGSNWSQRPIASPTKSPEHRYTPTRYNWSTLAAILALQPCIIRSNCILLCHAACERQFIGGGREARRGRQRNA